ncbi:MAG TPA: CDP-alcohol phosphatidyltransferase family protein [Candidatus Pacearchaeota archaeon]|nr:CDP-alcohol phosphatidyltransferase family protein [Candidatus Pacearchaeota archaeon]HOU46069.1 CDP-alcohol phosphatidyltransferase family protein [Candidatus Pacearchaeota archaeon]HPM08612.1 CDP-alcohol phosphatidyltransferase family protein [Candidatus Pacearchaeota archaeon]HQI74782.1 CDP-alcohol phosphatidyltransferase family protein [Candidatus Pacearchaeota archaeon]
MLDLQRDKFKWLEDLTSGIFTKIPLTANQFTLLSIVFALGSMYFLFNQEIWMGILMFLISGYLDLIDGAVARKSGTASKVGAYIDTIVDRYVEVILCIGMMFLPFDDVWNISRYIWITLVISGSLITTYAKAAAKEKDLVSQELKGGLLSRGERILLLLAVLILTQYDWTFASYLLAATAILANFTALQRIFHAIKLNKVNG